MCPPRALTCPPFCVADGQLDTDVCEFHEETTVKFSELSEDLLWEYIDSGEPM